MNHLTAVMLFVARRCGRELEPQSAIKRSPAHDVMPQQHISKLPTTSLTSHALPQHCRARGCLRSVPRRRRQLQQRRRLLRPVAAQQGRVLPVRLPAAYLADDAAQATTTTTLCRCSKRTASPSTRRTSRTPSSTACPAATSSSARSARTAAAAWAAPRTTFVSERRPAQTLWLRILKGPCSPTE